MRYTTKADVIAREIEPALGDYPGEYDMEAIADAAYVYKVDTDKDGNELLNTAGFEQCVSEARFWRIVERHAKA